VVNEDNFTVEVAKPGTSDMIHTYFKVKRHRLERPVSDFCRDKDWAAKAAVSCSFVFGAPEVCLCCAWVRTACAGWGGVFEYTVPPHDIRCPLRPRPTTPPCPVVVPAQAHEDRACGPGEKARKAAKEAAAEGAEEDGQPAPKSPLKKRGLPGNSTVFPIRAVPWPWASCLLPAGLRVAWFLAAASKISQHVFFSYIRVFTKLRCLNQHIIFHGKTSYFRAAVLFTSLKH